MYIVVQLHQDFLRAGSDVIQALTFYSNDGKMKICESSKSYDVRKNIQTYTSEHFDRVMI